MVYTVGAWSCYFDSESKNIEGEGCDGKAKAAGLMVAGKQRGGIERGYLSSTHSQLPALYNYALSAEVSAVFHWYSLAGN